MIQENNVAIDKINYLAPLFLAKRRIADISLIFLTPGNICTMMYWLSAGLCKREDSRYSSSE
jgi:hypothetical protein